jgi:hypothetical protein
MPGERDVKSDFGPAHVFTTTSTTTVETETSTETATVAATNAADDDDASVVNTAQSVLSRKRRETFASSVVDKVGRHFVSELVLERVRQDQSGNYSCRPSNARAASVRLHLIDGEEIKPRIQL